ncbi:MAG: hypothetical protein ABI395_05405 [Sphingobium sp.]
MRKHRVEGFRRYERFERRQRDEISAGIIKGGIAAVPHIGRLCREEGFGAFDPSGSRESRTGLGRISIDLIGVEHGKGPGEHTAGLTLVAIVVFALRRERLPQQNEGRFLAPADLRAMFCPLAIGGPVPRAEPGAVRFYPQEERIDPAIGSPGERVGRGTDTAAPVPRHVVFIGTGFDGGCNLIRDPLIDICFHRDPRRSVRGDIHESRRDLSRWRQPGSGTGALRA